MDWADQNNVNYDVWNAANLLLGKTHTFELGMKESDWIKFLQSIADVLAPMGLTKITDPFLES